MNLAELERSNAQNRPTIVAGLGGEAGGILESGTTTRTGEFKAIQVLTAAVFHTDTVGNVANINDAAGVPAGHIIHGLFTAVKLVSGSVVLYRC